MYTLSGETTLSKLFGHPSINGSATLKGQNSAPRVDPFSEGAWNAGEQIGSWKGYLPWQNGKKSTKCIQYPLSSAKIIFFSFLHENVV